MSKRLAHEVQEELVRAQTNLASANDKYQKAIQRRRIAVQEATEIGMKPDEIADKMGIKLPKVYALLRMPER